MTFQPWADCKRNRSGGGVRSVLLLSPQESTRVRVSRGPSGVQANCTERGGSKETKRGGKGRSSQGRCRGRPTHTGPAARSPSYRPSWKVSCVPVYVDKGGEARLTAARVRGIDRTCRQPVATHLPARSVKRQPSLHTVTIQALFTFGPAAVWWCRRRDAGHKQSQSE